MATLCREGSYVCLELGKERRDLLFSVAITRWFADSLDEFAGGALLAPAGEQKPHREPSVLVDAVVNGGRAQVRLRFGWWGERLFFASPHAVNLGTWLRMAADRAERELRWLEERDPQALLR